MSPYITLYYLVLPYITLYYLYRLFFFTPLTPPPPQRDNHYYWTLDGNRRGSVQGVSATGSWPGGAEGRVAQDVLMVVTVIRAFCGLVFDVRCTRSVVHSPWAFSSTMDKHSHKREKKRSRGQCSSESSQSFSLLRPARLSKTRRRSGSSVGGSAKGLGKEFEFVRVKVEAKLKSERCLSWADLG